MLRILWIVCVVKLLLAGTDGHKGDGKCLRKFGICQDPSLECHLGEYHGVCGEDGNNQCCVPFTDRKCRALGGTCQDPSSPCQPGQPARYVDSIRCGSGSCCLPYNNGECSQRIVGAVCAGENDFVCRYGFELTTEFSRCERPDAHCCLPAFPDPRCDINIHASPEITALTKTVKLEFINEREETVTLNWVDRNGDEVFKAHVPAGKTHKEQSHAKQHWVCRDSNDDVIYFNRKCKYTATADPKQEISITYTL